MSQADIAARTRNEPPARLTVGATTRHFGSTAPSGDPGQFRKSPAESPVPMQDAPATDPYSAYMASIAFTMATPLSNTYAGGEVETGVLNTSGSSAAGAYGVFGLRQPLAGVNFALELAAGRRWVRYDLASDTLGKFTAEPRLRADIWLDPRFTLGATAGLTLGDQTVWMVGAFLGIHSHDFGSSR